MKLSSMADVVLRWATEGCKQCASGAGSTGWYIIASPRPGPQPTPAAPPAVALGCGSGREGDQRVTNPPK